jgi:hypothetical protein
MSLSDRFRLTVTILGRCLGLGIGLGLLLLGGGACSRRQPPQARQARQAPPPPLPPAPLDRQAAQHCLSRREQLHSRLQQLRRSERELLRLRRATPSFPVPRPVWDEAKEQRYSPVDQEIDRQNHERELAAWRQSRAAFQAGWRRRHAAELAAEQTRLNRLAAELRQSHPDLFSGPISIELNPGVLERLQHCPLAPA